MDDDVVRLGGGTHSRVTTLHLEMDRGCGSTGVARVGLGASMYRVWGMYGS